MNCNNLKNYKAAIFFAAFLFLNSSYAMRSIDNIKTKASELLAQRQKDKAIQLIINYSATERSKAYKAETSELLFNVAQSFMSREAQEDYEVSINETLENEKKSLKSVEKCLKVEPQNLNCLIQQARLFYRLKNTKNFENTLNEIKNLVKKSSYESLFQLFLEKNLIDFKNKQILSTLPTQANDRSLFLIIFEIDRSFLVKNYSRAKEVILFAEKNYADWPDIAYYKYKLNQESSEKEVGSNDDFIAVYNNKCKNVSHSISRKYRYDFDLCNRGIK